MRAAIVLAGGSSRRFADGNKLLARWRGAPLIAHAIHAARRAPVGRVIVVTGADRARVGRAARGAGRVTLAHARDHAEGIAASLRAGLRALWPAEDAVFLFLGDMPRIDPLIGRRLVRLLRPGIGAVRPRAGGVPGHPVLLRRPTPATVTRLRGDMGLGVLLRAGETAWIEVPPSTLRDVDTRRDLTRL